MPLSFFPITRTAVFTGGLLTLTEIIGGLTRPIWIGSVTLRAGESNDSKIEWQDPNAQIGGYLEAREAATIEFASSTFMSDRLRFSGQVGDIAYFTIAVPVSYFDQGVVS